MEIAITHHAIEQYKERTRDWGMSDEKARKDLALIAERGTIVRTVGNCNHMVYNGMAIVVAQDKETRVVVTFMGNKKQRAWYNKNELRPRYSRAAL